MSDSSPYKCNRCRWRGRTTAMGLALQPHCPQCGNRLAYDIDRAAKDVCDRVFSRTLPVPQPNGDGGE